jgi:hypothetical protein
MQRAYVGTSGWSYRSWEGTFYPSGVTKIRHFEFYATRFARAPANAKTLMEMIESVSRQ